MNKWELLKLLRSGDGEYISGEYISKKFNVTRTAIWKNIKELKASGYDIISKTNNGYKLMVPFDILNDCELEHRFGQKNLPYRIVFKTTVDSTNNEAKKVRNTSENTVVAALEQTGGRGRYNRSFLSKHGVGIYFTLKINSAPSNLISIDDVTFYPLTAALSVCTAIKKISGVDLKIKWPNDLLYGDKKICGILTEASIEAETRYVSYVIVGIGVNINNDCEDFPNEIRDIATSLKIITGKKYDRADVLCEIVNDFTNTLQLPHDTMLEEYGNRLITNRKISFSQNNVSYVGMTRGVNSGGNLIVALQDDTEMIIQSGEIAFIKS